MRYLSPVYSPLSWSEIWSAAVSPDTGRGRQPAVAAPSAIATRYAGFDVHLTNSGTSALTLALGLALERVVAASVSSPLVAVPAYSCPDIATAVLGARAQLVPYDVNPASLEPDWDSVRLALQAGARVLVVAHLYGRVVDLKPAHMLAAEFGALVVEDAAQHAGGSVHGVRGGSQATLGVLSFGRGKGINAGGGGALLCRQADHWPDIPLVSESSGRSALTKAALAEVLAHPLLYGIPARVPALGIGSTAYHAPRPVYSMPSALVPLLVSALEQEASEVQARRRNERTMLDALDNLARPGVQLPLRAPESGALRTPTLLAPSLPVSRAQLHALGVVRSYPRTLIDYPEFVGEVRRTKCGLLGAARLAAETYTLPTHRHVRDQDRRDIVRLISRR